MPKWIFIPIYGAVRAIGEHAEIGRQHKIACNSRNYTEMNRLFDQSWGAMDRATAGLWITVGELAVAVIAVALIASR